MKQLRKTDLKLLKTKRMENYNKIQSLVENMSKDIDSFYVKGNKSAGTRVRSACQELKKLAQELRVNVQETKNSKA